MVSRPGPHFIGDPGDPGWALHPGELQPGMTVASWRILGRLGEGGYGYVYLAEMTGVQGPRYTLKLSRFREGEGCARALREVAVLSQVEHPNVVRPLAFGAWPHPERGWPFLVMEYIDGPHLWRWLRSRNPTAREVAAMASGLAAALAAVHRRGAVHRDLKGDNILVRASSGHPVLLDFGIGDWVQARTLTFNILPPGTAHFRSPEALRFWRTNRAVRAAQPGEEPPRYAFQPSDDLYALGVLLYRLLTDEYPFCPESPPDILFWEIESQAPVAPAALNPRVPRALSELALRLLAKRPEARPSDAEALHKALEALCKGEGEAWDAPLFEWTDEPPLPEDGPWRPLARRRSRLLPPPAVVPGPRVPTSVGLSPVGAPG